MFDDSQHPLYRAAESLLARGMSRRQLLRLKRLFAKHDLTRSTSFDAALTAAGILINP